MAVWLAGFKRDQSARLWRHCAPSANCWAQAACDWLSALRVVLFRIFPYINPKFTQINSDIYATMSL